MTSVLEATPPSFSADDVARIAAELFGLDGMVKDLGSERDQTFLAEGPAGSGVIKISNLGEQAATLDLEAEAILHILRVDPELPVAQPHQVSEAAGAAAYRTTVEGRDGTHFVRLFERLHGRSGGGTGAPDLSDGAVRAYGEIHARLNLALRGFFHPAAGRELLWDLAHAARLRQHLEDIADREKRRLVDAVLDRYEEHAAPRWPRLRAQVVHGDLNLDNVLLDDEGRICGIVDFGDAVHTAQVADFAVDLASLMRGRQADEVFRVGRIAIDGYSSRVPLEPEELELLGDLVATRLAQIVVISAWRVARYPENAANIQSWDADSWRLLELIGEIGGDRFSRELGAPAPLVAKEALARRRSEALGAALTPLTYDDPLHVVRGEGSWLIDADGRRILDAYNNVPVLGHCHPRVAEAVVRQTRALNTNARYLYEPLVELAERLLASMPPEAALDSAVIVNSGSEANDIAWRIATAATGRSGAIVTHYAYHGVTAAMADLSPEEWPEAFDPAHVERIPHDAGTAEVAAAAGRLAERGHPLAATFIDPGFTSDGIHPPTPARLQEIAAATRDAGGLFVADEVQVGHGRSGEHLWSFAHLGVTPDFVVLGKPMGNGYPVAAVITRSELVEASCFASSMFSTFGGNPVAAQAALATLDAIEDEQIIPHTKRVGELLRGRLEELSRDHPAIVDVRGLGLLIGVELERPDRTNAVMNAMRDAGVLVGQTGPRNDVLKIRPPLVLGAREAEVLVAALDAALTGTSSDV
jgi:4-aminobutyrate aminotransferase-like enzyme/Ser/Thr protein kinase RdoA (MazF antagonist)